MGYRLGIDVGGTFTDLYLLDESGERHFAHKVSSTPDDPSRAIVQGTLELLQRHNIGPREVSYLSHGTTVATNTVLQHAGAKVGLITTEGFRDLLEIARQKRPSVYDLFAEKPLVLAPRCLRREVSERVAYDGKVITKLDRKGLAVEIRRLLKEGVAAIAIGFLHSYANPAHERLAKEIAQQIDAHVFLSVSHELTSEFREYERFLTAVLNAYVGPKLHDYLTHLQESLRSVGVTVEPHIIQSNGGLMSIPTAAQAPVRTVLSGPSAGVVGAAYVAKLAGIPDIITLDMGGTSTDVSLLRGARPSMEAGQRIAGYPIRVPAVAIHTIGAGGGSIAWTDDANGFHVGPRSAGAAPGPAAYGKGGDLATVTDANIFLGRLNQKTLLGGAMPIYKDLAAKAIVPLAKKLGLPEERTAAGILQIVVSAMVRAVRVISVEKGEDPRDFALMAFGGAGALHATAVARQLGIKTVFVPPAPGLLCSMGALLAAPTMEYSRTRVLAAGKADEIARTFAELKALAKEWLVSERVPAAARQLQYSVDMRYVGQNHELTVTLASDKVNRKVLAAAALGFHKEHHKQFGYSSPEDAVQVVSCRVVAMGVATKIASPVQPLAGGPMPAPRETRRVYFEDQGKWLECPVYWRGDIAAGSAFQGPAIVEQLDATTVMYPQDSARVDAYGNILIAVGRDLAEDRSVGSLPVRVAPARTAAVSAASGSSAVSSSALECAEEEEEKNASKMPSPRIDPITLEVVGNALMAASEEVAASLIRTAYSSNIKERADCSVAVFDGQGRLIVQAEHIPIHLGSMLTIAQNIAARFKPAEIHPGDVFLANDPYHGGGTHLPDITVAQPVFVGGELVAYVANIAHHSDVGGRVPGSNSGDTQHIFEEGLRLPPVKVMNAGELDQDVLGIIMLNSRLPHERLGDLKAQIASTFVGGHRIEGLYAKYGRQQMKACLEEMLNYAERRIRARIKAIPNGVYRFTDYLDDDGYKKDAIPISVTMTVKKHTLVLDFAGSGRHATGALNVVESALKATVFYAIKALLDPGVPSNAGFQRALAIRAPLGTIVNCAAPAPVSARTETCQRIVDVIFGAMASALPDRVLAACNSTLNGINISGVDPRRKEFYVYPETVGGGMGARPTKDGLDGVHVHVTNSSNLPIEALETEYPLRVERYELIQDSGGRGKYRGGMGIRRDIRIVGHCAELSTHADRQRFAPWGLAGGGPGRAGRLVINLGRKDERVLPSGKNSAVILEDGDVLTVMTPGGGGFGRPSQRDQSAAANDLLNDAVSKKKREN